MPLLFLFYQTKMKESPLKKYFGSSLVLKKPLKIKFSKKDLKKLEAGKKRLLKRKKVNWEKIRNLRYEI